MSNGFTTTTLSATGVNSTASIKILSPTYGGKNTAGYLQPSIGVNISGTVNTGVQWSGDDYTVAGYTDAAANWYPFTGMTGLSAAASGTIGAAMTMVRLTNTSGTTGTGTISVCQQGN